MAAASLAPSQPVQPYAPVDVSRRFAVMPRLEAIAIYEGEISCTNADLIRNHAYCWSHMFLNGELPLDASYNLRA